MILIIVNVKNLKELNNKELDIIYYDKNHSFTKQRYRFFHNEIDQNTLSFDKFIVS
ncbi:hypothetical protein F917_01881 [Acinetobacter baumannii NIPH 67]|nr:hypothetical protein F917_01881 [Acinetobacter baumannii NIPH 67]